MTDPQRPHTDPRPNDDSLECLIGLVLEACEHSEDAFEVDDLVSASLATAAV